MDYKSKYLKYKQKYLDLKNQHGGAKIGDHVYGIGTEKKWGEIIGENIHGEFDKIKYGEPIWIYNNTSGNTGYLIKSHEGTEWTVISVPSMVQEVKKSEEGAKIGDHVYGKGTKTKWGEIIGENIRGKFNGKELGKSIWIYNNTSGNTGYLVKANEGDVWEVKNPGLFAKDSSWWRGESSSGAAAARPVLAYTRPSLSSRRVSSRPVQDYSSTDYLSTDYSSDEEPAAIVRPMGAAAARPMGAIDLSSIKKLTKNNLYKVYFEDPNFENYRNAQGFIFDDDSLLEVLVSAPNPEKAFEVIQLHSVDRRLLIDLHRATDKYWKNFELLIFEFIGKSSKNEVVLMYSTNVRS